MKNNKIFNILLDFSILVVMLSFSYIVINFNSIKDYSSQLFSTEKKEEIKPITGKEKENQVLFLYNNSKEAKRNKENNNYEGEDYVNKLDLYLTSLLLIDKNINKEIEKKLKEKREELFKKKDQTFTKGKPIVKQDDFFSLSQPLTKEEEEKYGSDSYIVIPKINVEAPVFYPDIETPDIENHILELLKDGVVHRPETQLPYNKGNFFILGHSSNYSWINSKYNNVFAKIDFLDIGDKAYVYYKNRKYTYKLYEKKIVNADQLEVYGYIPGYNLSVMTCYPIGSTKKRMIALFQLEKNK